MVYLCIKCLVERKYFPSKQSKGRPLGVQDIFRSDSAFDERHGLLASSIHVTSVLRSLHWLKLPQCIPYNSAVQPAARGPHAARQLISCGPPVLAKIVRNDIIMCKKSSKRENLT